MLTNVIKFSMDKLPLLSFSLIQFFFTEDSPNPVNPNYFWNDGWSPLMLVKIVVSTRHWERSHFNVIKKIKLDRHIIKSTKVKVSTYCLSSYKFNFTSFKYNTIKTFFQIAIILFHSYSFFSHQCFLLHNHFPNTYENSSDSVHSLLL